MIPVPLAPPLAQPVARRVTKPWWFGNWAALALLLGSCVGAIVWGTRSSPVGFKPVRVDTTSLGGLELPFNDTWVIYEQGPGAAEPGLPPPLALSVREQRGTEVRVTPLVEPGQKTEVPAFRTPWYEGRAIGRFTVTRPGRYLVIATELPASARDGARYRPLASREVWVGPSLGTTWMNSPLALVPVCLAPLATAVVLLVVTRRRRAGSVTDHA